MTSWVRLFSNGTGKVNLKNTNPARNGFALQGGYGFDKSYGVPDNKNVLGYDSEGVEHVLNVSGDGNFVTFPNSISSENRTVQKFLPVPGITSIDAVIQKERIRKVTINWKCYGYAQLEYMTPYFLSPKISAFVEFGWNHFNPSSLLDLRSTNLNNLKGLFTNSGSLLYNQNIRNSFGLYDVTMGIVSGFDFSTQDGIVYDCKTEILSKHANFSGVQMNSTATVSTNKISGSSDTVSVQSKFSEYLEKRLRKIPNCIIKKRNFAAPLDEEEEKSEAKGEFLKFPFYKYSTGAGGEYTGLEDNIIRPEDRLFFGRRDAVDSDKDSLLLLGKSSYDWDYKDQNDVWVTMGFIVELTNVFFNKDLNIKLKDTDKYSLYEIDIDDVKIGAHPNLISCDGDILLIPNKQAPKYNLGAKFPIGDPEDNDYQKQNFSTGSNLFFAYKKPAKGQLSPFDDTLFKIFRTGYKPFDEAYNPNNPIALAKDTISTGFSDTLGFNPLLTIGKLITKKISGRNDEEKQSSDQSPLEKRAKESIDLAVFRDNLDGIINRFRYNNYDVPGTRSFPQWEVDDENGKAAGYWGYLKDLYVNTKVLIECAKSSETVEIFYSSLLEKINSAAAKIWELAIVDDPEDSSKLRIVDKKYVQYNKMKIYQFDVGSSNNFIKTLSFTAQLSNVAANQVISSATSNKKTNDNSVNGDVNSNQTLQFPYGDRFYEDGGIMSKPRKIDKNLEIIKQLQGNPQASTATKGSYIMSFKSYGPTVPTGQSRTDAASAAGPRTTAPLNPNIPAPPSRTTGGPRTTTPLNPNIPAPPSRAAAAGPRKTTSSSGTSSPGKITGWNIVNLVLPNDSLLIALMNDMDFKNNTNIYGGQQPGFTVELTLQGISGLRTFQLFSLKNLPSPYSDREIICQIVDISHKVDSANWTTTIKAGIRSIRGQSIKFTTDGVNEYTINVVN